METVSERTDRVRTLIIALALLIALVAGGIFYSVTLSDLSKKIIEHTDRVEEALIAHDLPLAKTRVAELKRVIQESKTTFHIIIDHSHLNTIETAMAELEQSLTFESILSAASKNAIIRAQMEDIANNHRFSWSNML